MDAETFGERLRRLRRARGIGQRALAAQIGKSKTWVVHVETGQRWQGKLPPLDDVRALARALGITVDELVGPEEGSPPGAAAPVPEPVEVALARIGAWPLDEEPPIELDQPVAAGRRGRGILQGVDTTAQRRRRDQRYYLVRIEGTCLEPRASPGDYAVFDPERPPQNGNLVVVAHGDRALVKYLGERNGLQYLLPLVGEPIPVEPGMRIVGVVTQIRRDPGNGPRFAAVR